MALPSLACGSVLKHVLISTLILVGVRFQGRFGGGFGKVSDRFQGGFGKVSGRFRAGSGRFREGFGEVPRMFFFGEVSGRFREGFGEVPLCPAIENVKKEVWFSGN